MSSEKLHVDAILAEFGERIGLGPLERDELGVCQLAFDESTAVNVGFNPANENIVLFGPVGAVPPHDREGVLSRVLAANLFWRETGGATLGLDPEANVVTLAYQVPQQGLDVNQFESLMDWFVGCAEAWRARLAELSAADGASPATEPAWGLADMSMKV